MESYLKPFYNSVFDRKDCEEMEGHREAFHNRMEFIKLSRGHSGTEHFPYDEYDLAIYLLAMYG